MANITVNDGICHGCTRPGQHKHHNSSVPVAFPSLSFSVSLSTSDSLSYPFLPAEQPTVKMPVKWTPENDQLVRLFS